MIKKSCNLIGQDILVYNFANQNFPRYGVCTRKQRTAMSFILGCFQRKVKTKFCENSKNLLIRPILGPFFPI